MISLFTPERITGTLVGTRGYFLSSLMIPKDRLHCPLDLSSWLKPLAHRCSTSTRFVVSSLGSEKLLASRARTLTALWNHHYYHYCLLQLSIVFDFRRLYPARLRTRRRVPPKRNCFCYGAFEVSTSGLENGILLASRRLALSFMIRLVERLRVGWGCLLLID